MKLLITSSALRRGRLSEKRNSILHSAWSETEAGEAILKREDYKWGSAPSKEDVDAITTETMELVVTINDARLHGFIFEHKSRRPAE